MRIVFLPQLSYTFSQKSKVIIFAITILVLLCVWSAFIVRHMQLKRIARTSKYMKLLTGATFFVLCIGSSIIVGCAWYIAYHHDAHMLDEKNILNTQYY